MNAGISESYTGVHTSKMHIRPCLKITGIFDGSVNKFNRIKCSMCKKNYKTGSLPKWPAELAKTGSSRHL